MKQEEIVELRENLSDSPLYSEDLAPVPASKRSWGMWNLAAIWVGMAVCIPTYLLASYMIRSGVSWYAALIIIGLANLIITVPMVLNGHAGVKFGIPFPVLGRASFGTKGVHIASILRAVVACGWFGVQTWIGGLAFYAIWNAVTGNEPAIGLSIGHFVGFGLFWLVNIYFIWKGTESIRWLEDFAAPILIIMGILLIVWGATTAGGFGVVLQQSKQLEKGSASLSRSEEGTLNLSLYPIKDKIGNYKATAYQLTSIGKDTARTAWQPVGSGDISLNLSQQYPILGPAGIADGSRQLKVQYKQDGGDKPLKSSMIGVSLSPAGGVNFLDQLWGYILWLTAMVGFWATMSLSIADITRYARTQKEQVAGQFIGLPGTMILYSFVGVFVTCAAVVNFKDVLAADDAPWDPVSLLARFESPLVVIVSQIFMLIATLSTNIAANVIAPSNAFSNLFPKQLSFRGGGIVTGIIGIIICPWWLLDEISGILIFISGLLGPVLAVLLCDYYVIRKKSLKLDELYKTNGIYAYGSGFNPAAMIALVVGILVALVGYWVPAVDFLYKLSWFSGFIVAFIVYYALMKPKMNVSGDVA